MAEKSVVGFSACALHQREKAVILKEIAECEMSMLNCFYSLQYANRGDLFEELNIWKYEKYQKIQGTWPVIFLSFADVKQANAGDAIQKIKKIIATVCHQFENILESDIFSDLNNLTVITTTSERYMEFFGFTEQEVFAALERFGMGEQKTAVKQWYDGFTFGTQRDIYNPWSITNFLKEKQLRPYWADTSSNGLINRLIQKAPAEIKSSMEELLQGKTIEVNFDEQIVFEQLEQDENAIWSLMVASGYLKVEKVEYRGMLLEPWYHLKITNLETISSFDTGTHPSEKTQPERFYHGFVLGLLVELRDRYMVHSNRESGYGRYDVMLIPKKKQDPAMILEFKVQDPDTEETLQDTVAVALKQIQEKDTMQNCLRRE